MESTINGFPEHKTKNRKGNIIKIGALGILMILQSINADSLPIHKNKLSQTGKAQTEVGMPESTISPKDDKESVEIDEELLFRSAVSTAVRPICNLKDIPVGGIQLKYPKSYTGDLPRSIDFFPKEMKAKTLPYTIIRIGKKMFIVTPSLGFVVDKMYIDKENFYVHVVDPVLGWAGKEKAKSKESELGMYLAKLYFQGEKASYTLSSVREVPEAHQAKALQDFEKINVPEKD